MFVSLAIKAEDVGFEETILQTLVWGKGFGGPETAIRLHEGMVDAASFVRSVADDGGVELDGRADESFWRGARFFSIDTEVRNTGPLWGPVLGRWKGTAGAQAFRVYVDVFDPGPIISDDREPWYDDSVEVFLAQTDGRSKPFQFTFRRAPGQPVQVGINAKQPAEPVTYAVEERDWGYAMEIQVPWEAVGWHGPPKNFRFDVHVNDDDDGGRRDRKVTWSAPIDRAWDDPDMLGVLGVGSAL